MRIKPHTSIKRVQPYGCEKVTRILFLCHTKESMEAIIADYFSDLFESAHPDEMAVEKMLRAIEPQMTDLAILSHLYPARYLLFFLIYHPLILLAQMAFRLYLIKSSGIL